MMQRVKTDSCNRLTPSTLSQHLLIKLNGPPLCKFDPRPAVMKWLEAGPRRCRPASTPYTARTHNQRLKLALALTECC